MNHLRVIAQILKKDYDGADKGDITGVVRKIEEKRYSDWTKHDYKVTLKKFYRWLRDSEEYPDEVRWIKTTVRKCKTKLPGELLTEDDVKRLVNVADNLRDKALVFSLYESGCRISELLSLRLRQVQFDQFGAQFVVSGGKGSRRVRLILSSPSLSQWVANHPLSDEPEAPLWVGFGSKNKNRPLSYPSVGKMLRTLKQKAKLTKPVNPHMFRHSRATILAKHLSEAQLKQIFGWTQASDMASVYVHLSGRDTDDALLNLYGLKKDEDVKETKLKARKCPRCEYVNPATNRFCGKCSLVLDPKAAMELDTKMGTADKLAAIAMEHRVCDFQNENADAMDVLAGKVAQILRKSS
jgi:site-specific recombinase XerD